MSFDILTTKIGPYLLVDVGFEGEKKKKSRQKKVYISPHCPDEPEQPIVTKFGKVGVMDEIIKHTNFGVDRLIGVGSTGS